MMSSTFVVFIIFLNFPVAQIFGFPGFMNEYTDFPGISKLKSSGIVTPLFQAFFGSVAALSLLTSQYLLLLLHFRLLSNVLSL